MSAISSSREVMKVLMLWVTEGTPVVRRESRPQGWMSDVKLSSAVLILSRLLRSEASRQCDAPDAALVPAAEGGKVVVVNWMRVKQRNRCWWIMRTRHWRAEGEWG